MKSEKMPSKEGRRAKVADRLEDKRFILSLDAESEKRLATLQEVVADLKKKYPEIIGLSLYGSLVKGYADRTSDIDGYLLYD